MERKKRNDFTEQESTRAEQDSGAETVYDGETAKDSPPETPVDEKTAAEAEEIALRVAELLAARQNEPNEQGDAQTRETIEPDDTAERAEFEQRLRRLLSAHAKQAAAEAERDVLARIRARALRPDPLPGSAAAKAKTDPRRLTRDQLRDIDIRVERGETVRF